MNEHTCPNCGAAVQGMDCPYCGTNFLVSIGDISGPVTVCFEKNGTKQALSMVITSISTHQEQSMLYCDSSPYCSIPGQVELTIDAILTDDVRKRISDSPFEVI